MAYPRITGNFDILGEENLTAIITLKIICAVLLKSPSEINSAHIFINTSKIVLISHVDGPT